MKIKKVVNQIFIQNPLHKIAVLKLSNTKYVHPLEILTWSKLFQEEIDELREQYEIKSEDITPSYDLRTLRNLHSLYNKHSQYNAIQDSVQSLCDRFNLPNHWSKHILSATFTNTMIIEDTQSIFPIPPSTPDEEYIGFAFYPKIVITEKLSESELKRQCIEAYNQLLPYLEKHSEPSCRLRYKTYMNAINILLLKMQREKLDNKNIDENWKLVDDYLNIFTITFKTPIFIKSAKDYHTATEMLSAFKEQLTKLTIGVSKH